MEPEQPVFGPPPSRKNDLYLSQRYTRWAVWGCATLILSGVLLFLGFMLVVMRQPGVLTSTEQVEVCRQHLVAVSGALDRYYQDHKRLPARLEDLYPTYLPKEADLHCPAAPKGTGTSYILRPNVLWKAGGDDVVVYCPYHPSPFKFRTQSGGYIVPMIRQDGSVERPPLMPEQMQAMGINPKDPAAPASSARPSPPPARH